MNTENPKSSRPTDEELAAYYGRPTQFKQLVYDLMNGSLDLDAYPLGISEYIADEFAEGGECDELYREMSEAKLRIFDRIGYDDNDVETMVDRCFDICEILCMKMYDYGVMFGV